MLSSLYGSVSHRIVGDQQLQLSRLMECTSRYRVTMIATFDPRIDRQSCDSVTDPVPAEECFIFARGGEQRNKGGEKGIEEKG